MPRTRIKICGLTRPDDVAAAVECGVDALGFVFYPKSPRYVLPSSAAQLVNIVPPFVSTVGLFVNATADEVAIAVEISAISMLQFHGDETPEQSAAIAKRVNRPYLVAIRVKPEMISSDLLEYEQRLSRASGLFSGLLLDTWTDAYGGSGKTFDWSIVTPELGPRIVLSGGLQITNVRDAVSRIRPYAVDISSGVESREDGIRKPGLKDHEAISLFVEEVRCADKR
jgi:phosphoribosylanthranilate isomerase